MTPPFNLYVPCLTMFFLEDWRLLWKANWTNHAAHVLKNFETDVILKVEGSGLCQ